MGSGRKALQIGTHYHPFLRKMVSVSLVTTLLLQLLPPILSARPSFCSVLKSRFSSCSCDRGHTAVRLDDTGRPRGNCTGVPFDSFNDNQKPWCFLKNIPKQSTKCFKDAKWSRKDGRFWSYKACSAQESGEG